MKVTVTLETEVETPSIMKEREIQKELDAYIKDANKRSKNLKLNSVKIKKVQPS